MSAILGPDLGKFKGLACDPSTGASSSWSWSYPKWSLVDHPGQGQPKVNLAKRLLFQDFGCAG